MSQFTLTLEEDAIITDALRAKATQYTAMFGAVDPTLEALIAKLESYNPVFVEEPAEVTAAAAEAEALEAAEEKPAKAKKAKAVEAPAAE